MITRLAMEAKVRFMGAVEEVAVAMVEAIVEEELGEYVGVLQAKVADVVEADVRLEEDDIVGISGVEQLGTSGVFFGAGKGGVVETVLEVDLEEAAGVKGFGPSKERGESIGLEMV